MRMPDPYSVREASRLLDALQRRHDDLMSADGTPDQIVRIRRLLVRAGARFERRWKAIHVWTTKPICPD